MLDLKRTVFDRWSTSTLQEVSGSVGDLGTFVPIFVALTRERAIYGLSNIATGLVWDIPMPVQPMKSIAAAALMQVLSRQQVLTSGVITGAILCFLGATNTIDIINGLVPTSVVGGIQVGIGLSLAVKGIQMIADLQFIGKLDCSLFGAVFALISILLIRRNGRLFQGGSTSSRRWTFDRLIPVGLLLLGFGILISIFDLCYDRSFRWNVSPITVWALRGTTWNDWRKGLIEGTLPQLPLSVLNSVVSVCCLARSLFPDRLHLRDTHDVLTRREVCVSVGLMNILLCPFGALPCCHGAGGLAGQYRFGARHGSSPIVLGFVKVALAVGLRDSVATVLDRIPSSILGILLTISGLELSRSGLCSVQEAIAQTESDCEESTSTALLVASVILGTKKAHYGALFGFLVHSLGRFENLIPADQLQQFEGTEEVVLLENQEI